MEIIEIAGGVALADVTDLLPRHATRRWSKRTKPVSRVYFHKSGKLGAAGLQGAINSARYCVTKREYPRDPKNPGWAGMPYTFWIPFRPLSLVDLRLETNRSWETRSAGLHSMSTVVFRCQPDDLVSWHTGGNANQIGVGVCFQGNSTVDGLSENQIEIAEAIIPWLFERYGIGLPEGLSWHSDKSEYGPPKTKPVCPGAAAVAWLEAYRAAGSSSAGPA